MYNSGDLWSQTAAINVFISTPSLYLQTFGADKYNAWCSRNVCTEIPGVFQLSPPPDRHCYHCRLFLHCLSRLCTLSQTISRLAFAIIPYKTSVSLRCHPKNSKKRPITTKTGLVKTTGNGYFSKFSLSRKIPDDTESSSTGCQTAVRHHEELIFTGKVLNMSAAVCLSSEEWDFMVRASIYEWEGIDR
jgi:hypothetical protein